VEAGKTLDDTWNAGLDNLGRYDLWVLGPNGYHRHFIGDTGRITDSGAQPEIRVCYDIANGNVYAELINGGTKACTFTVEARAYREDGPWTVTVAPGAKESLHWELADSGRWYDFEVSCGADAAFRRRFAGRVETVEHSVSDPAMGEQG